MYTGGRGGFTYYKFGVSTDVLREKCVIIISSNNKEVITMDNKEKQYYEDEIEKLSRQLIRAEGQADLYAKQLRAMTNDGRNALTLCEIYKIMINLTEQEDISDETKAKNILEGVKGANLLDLSRTETFILARIYEKLEVIKYHDEIQQD